MEHDQFAYEITAALTDERVWRDAKRALTGLPANVLEACSYGILEIANNAIEHSQGAELLVRIHRDAAVVEIELLDNGVGIFHKLRNALGLTEDQDVLVELLKGKLTTDPQGHSGQGIFFVFRVFDTFVIRSGTSRFRVQQPHHWTLEDVSEEARGTHVSLRIATDSPTTLKQVFDRFSSDPEDYAFDRTEVLVALLGSHDEPLLSRSQARRLLARFDLFREVTLDFQGVESIGQAFADEIFRVFRRAHPDITLRPVNAGPAVMQMIRRAENHD